MASESTAEESILDTISLNSGEKKNKFEKVLRLVFGNVTKASATKQVVVGGGAGWLTGYLAVKVGKSAAITLGATVFLLQVAQHKGIITVNWTKVHHALNGVRDSAMSFIDDSKEDMITAVKRFYNDNFFLAAGFSGGLAAGVLF